MKQQPKVLFVKRSKILKAQRGQQQGPFSLKDLFQFTELEEETELDVEPGDLVEVIVFTVKA